jgi:hypothetical protein
VLDRFLGGPDPPQMAEEFFRLGPAACLVARGHFHRRLAVAAPVLDLR